MDPTTTIVSVVVGGIVVLIGKIVWDWLNARRSQLLLPPDSIPANGVKSAIDSNTKAVYAMRDTMVELKATNESMAKEVAAQRTETSQFHSQMLIAMSRRD